MPGDDPPEIVPYCQICDQPVQDVCMDVVKSGSEDVIGIHAECCGKQSSTRITLAVYRELLATGAKLYVIVRKGSQAGLRKRARHLRSVGH